MAKGGYVGIPMSYTPVEYIESSGTQYIDSEVLNTSVNKIEAEAYNMFGLVYNNKTYGGSLVGARVSATNSCFQYGTGADYDFVGNGTSQLSLTKNTNTTKLTLNYSRSAYSITCGNYSVSGNLSVTTTTALNMYVLGMNNNGVVSYGTWRLLYLKMYDENNNLLRDFIPVLDENNVACMYEQVEGKFYYNKGVGTFTAGSATGQPVSVGDRARKIKSGYVGVKQIVTPIEYIESTGLQCVNTEVVTDSTTKLEFDASIISGDSNVWMPVYGTRTASTSDYFCLYIQTSSPHYLSPNYAGFDPGTGGNTPIDFNQRYLLTQDKGKFYIDGVLKSGISTTNTLAAGSQPLFLFTNNALGRVQMRGQDIKLYGCKIYSNDTLIRDYIPVITQTSEACLYDKVQGKLYHNVGQGSFTAGNTTGEPDITITTTRKIDRGYVGVNGVARLCFGSSVYRSYKHFATKLTDHYGHFCVTNTEDYIIISGGRSVSSTTPTKATSAFNINLVATQCTDLPTQASYQGNMTCGGYGIIASGKSGSSGNNRTDQCIAYNNNLARTTMSTVTTSCYDMATASNSTHCILGGGTNYNSQVTTAQSYNSSLVKSSITAFSGYRRGQAGANLGDHLIFCGGNTSNQSLATDFYDNSNVRTTGTFPYSSTGYKWFPKGIGMNNHAIFCWGSTAESSGETNSAVSYDTNLVSTSFTMPDARRMGQGFSVKGNYAIIGMGSNNPISSYDSAGNGLAIQYIYNDSLVRIDTIETIRGAQQSSTAAATQKFGILFGVFDSDGLPGTEIIF